MNPVSGHPWSARRRAVRALSESLSNGPAEILITEEPRQATQWARARAMDPDAVVIAVGGDGTVHEVAAGLIGGVASLGVLPVGSGNDFASMLSNHIDLAKAEIPSVIDFFQSAPIQAVDVGWVELTHGDGSQYAAPFINSLGSGLEGAVAGTVQRLRSVKGLTRYVLATLWQVGRYRPLAMRLQSDCGRIAEEVAGGKLLVAIGNGRRAGGGFLLQPQASITDGYLDVCWAGELSVWQQLTILPSVFKGDHGRFKGVHQQQIRSITIDCEEGTPVHLDGEWVADRAIQLQISVKPAALPVVGLSA